MKVLDLQCAHRHVFEGWFASEDDFLSQCERGLVQCPVCADASITKKLSAPRLNLGSARVEVSDTPRDPASVASVEQTLQAAWMAVARRIIATTDDVGEGFAEEARKIHYGETRERGIRGKASRAETDALIEEGIAVMPLPLPEALKGQLQ
ncbi:MAG: DUF1178 family protein [Rhodoferax sp.]|nr:DUF1178 family protein [Rhodoferax sp.]